MQRNLFILLCVLLVTLLSCPRKPAYEAGFEIPEGPKRDVEVLYVAPAGGTEALGEVHEIMVSFNQPMVPLEGVPEFENDGPLKIEPRITGRYRWRGTSTLFFIPDEPLVGGTEYTCTVPKGIQSLMGTALKDDYIWRFTTAQPDLTNSKPYHNQKWVELDHNIYLLFSQKMSPDRAKPFITLEVRDGKGYKRNYPFSVRYMNDAEKEDAGPYWRPERTIVVDPGSDLPVQSEVMVMLKEGLPAALGEKGMEHERTLMFSTYNHFEIMNFESKLLNPRDAVVFYFSNPVIYNEFIEHISFTPAVTIPEHYKNWTHASDRLYLYLDLKPDTKYTVTVTGDVSDRFGNRLGKDETLSFRTTDYDPSLGTGTGLGIVESYSEKQHPFTFVNIEEVRKRIALLSRDQIIPTMLSRYVFYGWESYQPSFHYQVDEKWKIGGERNKRYTLPLDLKEALQTRNNGYVFFEVDALRKFNSRSRYHRGLLQVTGIGITGKFSSDNNLIWVSTLKDAQPLAGAEVELRDDANRILWRGYTDTDGLAETPGWKQLGMVPESRWDKPRIWVFARYRDDESFVASNEGTGIYPYDFGISYDWAPEPERFKGYLFTERGIYRAGEDVYIKAILREKIRGVWRVSKAVRNCDVAVYNSRDEEIYKDKRSFSDFGAFDITLSLAQDAPTGWYEIEMMLDDDTYFNGSFRVEAYRPAQFSVTARSENEEYVFGDDFKGWIKGWYLYGGPMYGESVEWTLSLDHAYYQPPGHKGYRFGPQYWYDDEDWEFEGVLASGSGTLDKNGRISIKQKIAHDDVKRTMLLTLEGTVTAQNRQTLSGRTNCLVHRGEYYVGIKPQKTFIDVKKPLEFLFISTAPDGTPVNGKDIAVQIVKREWTSVRKAGVEGRYEWITERNDSVVSAFKVKTGAGPVSGTFTPQQVGLYIITAQGKDGKGNTIITSTYFYATGEGYFAWKRRDDDRIEIVPDQDAYKPGDIAKILVKSPYEEALALVTVEREFIMERFTRKITGSTTIIELPITDDHLPNVYVSVILIQGRSGFDQFDEEGEDIGKPSFKIGYANLAVDPGSKHLDISITTDQEEYRPQDTVTVKIKVTDTDGRPQQAEVVFAAVDVGVLSLIDFQTPDPFPVFYGPRSLSVQTTESRRHVIGQRHYDEKGESRGGGGFGEGFAYRTEFLTTAYYDPTVRTDKNGEAVITFKLPDNLTTFRLMATGQTRTSSFGARDRNIRVKKPLLVLEALPRFARFGDEFEAGVVIHNNTGSSGGITIEADADNILLKGEKMKSVKIADGQEKEIRFSYYADRVGTATFRFKVSMGSQTDAIQLQIPVVAPRLLEAVALYGQTTDKVSEALQVPENIYLDIGYLELTTSSSAFVGLEGSVEYLIKYPYECLEQKTSRILPLIVARDLIEEFNFSEFRGKILTREVQTTIDEFKEFQHYNGGFKFWPDSWLPSPWLTAYVVYALGRANAQGYRIDQTMIQRALGYLQDVLRREDIDWEYPYNTNVQLTTKAYTLYALAAWDRYDYGYLSKLHEKRDQMSLLGKTLLLKAADEYGNGNYVQELRRILLNKMKMAATTAHFEEQDDAGMSWIWHSNVRTTALVLQAFLETGGEFPHAEKIIKWLVAERRIGRWRSTQENIYVFDAFNTYLNIYEKQRPDFTALVYIENEQIVKEIFKGRQLEIRRTELLIADLPQGRQLPVSIEKQGDGRLYYGMRMLYAPKGVLKPRDEGMAVFKVIEPLIEGSTGNELSAGKIYQVTISVVTPQERNFVVVDDPLPAGCEVINTSFDTESQQVMKMMTGHQYRGYDDYYYDDYEYYGDDYYYQSWGTFDHWEIYDDKVLLFADALYAGEHTFSYLVRAMTYGSFVMPSTKAEEMYTPEVFGYNRQRTLVVK